MSIFNRKNTLADLAAGIEKLTAARAAALSRQHSILTEAAESDAPDSFAVEFSKLDFVLQTIAIGIGKLESQRAELEKQAARKQLDQLQKTFEAARKQLDSAAADQLREAVRAQLISGQVQRVVNQLSEQLSGQRQQALNLIAALDLPPDESDALRQTFHFSQGDISTNVNEFYALKDELMRELTQELEKRYNVQLSVEA